jgi:NTP pyrophosphatase (non-canonical NTP hydrolase)
MSKDLNARAMIAQLANFVDDASSMLYRQRVRIEELEAKLKEAGIPAIKPIPCKKFKNASPLAWIAKIVEETDEVVQEAAILEEFADDEGMVDSDKAGIVDVNNRLAIELTDVITVCVSWLYALGYDEVARDEVQRHVNEKNCKRGYHDEA